MSQERECVWTIWYGLVPHNICIVIMIPLLSTNLTNFDINELGVCMEGKNVWRLLAVRGDGGVWVRARALVSVAGSP